MANLSPDIKILDPSTGFFAPIDGGSNGDSTVLLNILMELRVHTIYLQAMSQGIVNDEPSQLRLDVVSDPGSFQTLTPTSS